MYEKLVTKTLEADFSKHNFLSFTLHLLPYFSTNPHEICHVTGQRVCVTLNEHTFLISQVVDYWQFFFLSIFSFSLNLNFENYYFATK